MTCDGSGRMIGCYGCYLCSPQPVSQPSPAPPPDPVFAAIWERIDRERAEFERRYAENLPAY